MTTRRRRGAYNPTWHRLCESERLIKGRHGVVPDTDDAALYLVPVAQCLRRLCEQRPGPRAPTLRDRMQRWALRFAPDVPERVLDDAVDAAMQRDVIDKADVIAARWRVSYDERQRFKLRTIGAYDVDKAGRGRRAAARRRERDREHVRAKRRAGGKIERAVYLAGSLSAARPWEAEGISRRTWYRRRKAAQATRGTGVSPHKILMLGDTLVPPARHAGAATLQEPSGRALA